MTKKETSVSSSLQTAIRYIYICLFAMTPLLFYPKTSELFEFNKMLFVYVLTIGLVGSWLLLIIIQKRFIFKRSFLDIPLALFLSSQALSTLFSIDPRISLLGYYSRWNGGLLSLTCYALFYWGAVTFLSKSDIKKNVWAILFSTTVASLWGIGEHFGMSASCLAITGKFDVACWVQEVSLRVYATFGQPNWMAAWVSAVIPLTWIPFLTEKKQLIRSKSAWFAVTLNVIFLLGLLYTKSRSGILALGVTTILFWVSILFVSFREKVGGWVKSGVLSLALLAFVTAGVGTPWTPSIFSIQEKEEQTTNETTLPALETGGTESGDIRKIVWNGAVSVWKKYPLLGSGVETFALSYYQGRPMEHNMTSEWNFLYNKSHNEYLNFLATTGIVGLTSYLVVILCILIFLLKALFFKSADWDTKSTILALTVGFINVLITNFFGFSVVTTNLLFFVFPAFAVVLLNTKEKEHDAHSVISSWQWICIVCVVLSCLYLFSRVGNYFLADLSYAEALNDKSANDYSSALKNINQSISRSGEPIYTDLRADLYGTLAQVSDQSKETALTKTLIERTLIDLETVKAASPVNVKLLKSRANILSDIVDIDPTKIPLLVDTLHLLARLAPTDPSVLYQRGLAYAKQGEMDKALKDVETAVFMKPNYKIARRLLSLLYKEDKQIERHESNYSTS